MITFREASLPRAIMDFEQVAPLAGVGAPPTVYSRWIVRFESG